MMMHGPANVKDNIFVPVVVFYFFFKVLASYFTLLHVGQCSQYSDFATDWELEEY